ncbi:MAG: YraN family protein [Deltaproteobacteria bacterium]|nr:YraN family protein [Deltaproteobacteria bacterium]
MTSSAQAKASQARGRRAEDLVRRHLEAQGWRVAAQNHRTPAGELDLVAWDQEVLVFVEVKARRPRAQVGPLEAVDRRKRRRLTQAAGAYLASLAPPVPSCRFDVVAVELDGASPQVRHVVDAFRPED